jgi:hypothetical protein
VDFNGDGEIAFTEFVEFWEIVKGSGHSEDEIKEEVSLRNIQRIRCCLISNKQRISQIFPRGKWITRGEITRYIYY